MQRTSKSTHASWKWQVWVRQCTADKMWRMSTDISTFVVTATSTRQLTTYTPVVKHIHTSGETLLRLTSAPFCSHYLTVNQTGLVENHGKKIFFLKSCQFERNRQIHGIIYCHTVLIKLHANNQLHSMSLLGAPINRHSSLNRPVYRSTLTEQQTSS